MRLPFVSAATYDWAIRAAERHADEADREAKRADVERHRASRFYEYWQTEVARVVQLTETIVAMKRENFVVDVPVTNTALSVDEADEYAVADEEAKPGLLKRKLGA